MTRYNFLPLIFCLSFLATLYLTYFSYKYVKSLSNLKDVTKAKRLIEGCICGIIFILLWLVHDIIHLSVFISISLAFNLALLIVAASELWTLAKIRYWLSKSPCDSIGNYYITEHVNYLDKGNLLSAEESIVSACAFNPQNPRAWLLRSNFADHHKDELEEAKKYLETAGHLIEKHPNPDKEILANYEFCQGNILISENKLPQALIHFKKSQELVFSDEKANFIKKIEDTLE